jgi:hypothetical protein
MRKELSQAIDSLVIQSKFEGIDLTIKEGIGNAAIIANISAQKVALLGIDDKNSIHALMININRWKWAEDEGFTMEDVIEKLSDEIFTEVHLHRLVYELNKKQ